MSDIDTETASIVKTPCATQTGPLRWNPYRRVHDRRCDSGRRLDRSEGRRRVHPDLSRADVNAALAYYNDHPEELARWREAREVAMPTFANALDCRTSPIPMATPTLRRESPLRPLRPAEGQQRAPVSRWGHGRDARRRREFGGDADDTEIIVYAEAHGWVVPEAMPEQKFAVLINADPDHTGPTANEIEYALDLDGSGYQVDVYFDGAATQWPSTLEENPDNPVNKYYQEVREKGLIDGACGFCANAYGTYD